MDTYALKLVVKDDTDQYDDVWNFRLATHSANDTITEVAAAATTVDLKVAHSTATSMTQNRTLVYQIGEQSPVTKTVTGVTATYDFTLTDLTSEGYVITITSIN